MSAQAPAHPRRLALATTYNVRDVGGYLTRDGRATRWRTLLRADSPHRLRTVPQQELVDFGLKTVIDLRGASEIQDARFAESVALNYFNLFLVGDPTVPDEVSPPRTPADSYRAILQHRGETLTTIVSHLAEPSGLAALVHCTAGKDRTGIVIALPLSLAGVADETIVTDYELSATYLVGTYFDEARQRAEKAGGSWESYHTRLICPASLILGTLNWLADEFGDARSYLMAVGADPARLDVLRDRLLEW